MITLIVLTLGCATSHRCLSSHPGPLYFPSTHDPITCTKRQTVFYRRVLRDSRKRDCCHAPSHRNFSTPASGILWSFAPAASALPVTPLPPFSHSSGNPSYRTTLQSCTLFCSPARPCQRALRGESHPERSTQRWIYFSAHFTGEKWRQRLGN